MTTMPPLTPASNLQIWVDADACPNVIKEILFRVAERRHLLLTLVANQSLRIPRSPHIKTLLVPGGFDAADRKIVELVRAGDLVITADIPLAAGVIDKGGHALNPRGERYTRDNIQARLSLRNFMEEQRNIGVNTGGPPVLGPRDRQAFANALDIFIHQNIGPRQ